MTFSLSANSVCFASSRKDISARSVLFPPMTALSEIVALLLIPMPVTISFFRTSPTSDSFLNCFTSPVAISVTVSLPSVIVPVLSLKRMLKLPAVSRPLILCTRTLSLIIRMLWKEDRMDVNDGKPSGTAHTMMVTEVETAATIKNIHACQFSGMCPVSTFCRMIAIIIPQAPT